jgi:hypothetical protein
MMNRNSRCLIIWEIYTSDWTLCMILTINLFLISAYTHVLIQIESSCNYLFILLLPMSLVFHRNIEENCALLGCYASTQDYHLTA